jgi:hypothetical protein
LSYLLSLSLSLSSSFFLSTPLFFLLFLSHPSSLSLSFFPSFISYSFLPSLSSSLSLFSLVLSFFASLLK